jgi:hypothetical protein
MMFCGSQSTFARLGRASHGCWDVDTRILRIASDSQKHRQIRALLALDSQALRSPSRSPALSPEAARDMAVVVLQLMEGGQHAQRRRRPGVPRGGGARTARIGDAVHGAAPARQVRLAFAFAASEAYFA